jgi:hypothetical protein
VTTSSTAKETFMPSAPSHDTASARRLIRLTLSAWLVAVLALGSFGLFVRPAGAPPFPILFGFALPIAVFLGLYFGSRAFRQAVLEADLGFVTAVQAWRAGGLGFLALYTYGVLPGLFAWPAGLGDIAVGITAPALALSLARDPAVAQGRRFVVWNLLGVLDLVVAVSMGAVGSGFISGFAPEVSTTPMSQMPLVLIPAYLVPLFVMLHLTALFQVRRKTAAAPRVRLECNVVAA